MYDLLNEPNCDVNSYLQKNNLVTISVYNRLYKAIREVDKDHIMTMEGIWRLYNLPAPWFIGWTNVVYQLHFYDTSNFMYSLLVFFAKLYPYNVPLYVGEFKPMGSGHMGSRAHASSTAQTSAGLSGHIRAAATEQTPPTGISSAASRASSAQT